MITIKTNAAEVASCFDKLDATLQRSIVQNGVHKYLAAVQATARRDHRYIRRTGKLLRSVRMETNTDGGSVYIDEGLAPYGKYVHDGTRHISSDPFLYEAADANEHILDSAASDAVDHAIKAAGLR